MRPVLRAASLGLLSTAQWWLLSMVLGGVAVFAALADGARESGDLSSIDPSLHDTIVAHRSTAVTPIAEGLTFVGNLATMLALTVLVLAFLTVVRKERWQAAVFAAAMAGSAAMTYLGKLLIGRHRPSAQSMMNGIDAEFAFPSGHTLNATVFFGMIAVLVIVGSRSALWKAGALVVAVAVPAGIGLSRLYLGYHWFTDVLGAWFLGVSWVCALGFVLVSRSSRIEAGSAALAAPVPATAGE